MLHALLYFFIFSIYGATPPQPDLAEASSLQALATQLESRKLAALNNCGFTYIKHAADLKISLNHAARVRKDVKKPIVYETESMFYDHHSATFKQRYVAFITAATEIKLCTVALQNLTEDDCKNACFCTTLESSANLVCAANGSALQINVGEKTDDGKHNDFSHILQKNKDKTTFIFAESAAGSLLSAGEFLMQLQSSEAVRDDTKIIVCVGALEKSGDYTVGDLYYGKGKGRVEDKWSGINPRLIERATQAERIAQDRLCNALSSTSTQSSTGYLFWKEFVTKHVKTTSIGHLFEKTLFASQTPGSVLVPYYPDKDFASELIITKSQHLTVLIGAPADLDPQERAYSWGCSIRVFNQLQAEEFNVSYIFAPDKNLCYSAKKVPPYSRLICAGPADLQDPTIVWARTFLENPKSDTLFAECNALKPSQDYHHIYHGVLLDYTDAQKFEVRKMHSIQ